MEGNNRLKRQILEITKWMNRTHGEIDFHITQYLTMHGCFMIDLKRKCKVENDLSDLCITEGTPEHIIFLWECTKHEYVKENLVRRVFGFY